MNERIWIYTLSQPLSAPQLTELQDLCQRFVGGWTAHEVSLDASFDLHKERLLIFRVNEAKYNASGCSIDKQLRFVKELEQKFNIQLLNRLLVAYEDASGAVQVAPQAAIKGMLDEGTITAQTPVYINTITHSAELNDSWKKPLTQTWLNKYAASSV